MKAKYQWTHFIFFPESSTFIASWCFSCFYPMDAMNISSSLSPKYWVKLCRKDYFDFLTIPFDIWINTRLSEVFFLHEANLPYTKCSSVLFRVCSLSYCAVLIRIWISDLLFSHQQRCQGRAKALSDDQFK